MRLFVFGVLLFFQSSPQPPPRPTIPSHKPEQVSPDKQKTPDSDNSKTKPALTTTSKDDTIANNQGAKNSSADESEKATENKWIMRFTGALAGVAVLQLFILALQFWAAHRQAEYLQSAERAHMDLNVTGMRETFYATATNYGKSLATLIELGFSHASFPDDAKEYSLDDALAKFEDSRPFNHLFPPGKASGIHEININQFLTQQEKDGIHLAIFSWYIVYLDIFGQEHETEVLYRWRSIKPILENVPEYNRYT